MGGKGGGKKGGKGGKKGGSNAPPGIPWNGPLPPFPSGNKLMLHHGDSDPGFGYVGDSMTRARRMESTKPWIGVRGNCGVSQGKVAFAFLNETGGNIRLGWSTIDATIELGMDAKSFGYGGTGTASHNGQYTKYGTTFGQNAVVTALLDLERHSLGFMVDDIRLPKEAHNIPRELWGEAFFPHVLVKEATFEVYFGPSQGTPPIFITPPRLPDGFEWLSEVGNFANPRVPQTIPQIIDSKEAAEATKKALESMMSSMAKNQACHRQQFEEWKQCIDDYTKFFKPLLNAEYEEEKRQVQDRTSRLTLKALQRAGLGCGDVRIAFIDAGVKRGADVNTILITASRGGLPPLSELKSGRSIIISNNNKGISFTNSKISISAEITKTEAGRISATTTYSHLPLSQDGLYRIDAGTNEVSFERIANMLDRLQRAEPDHVQSNVNYHLGIFNPGTEIANSLFADIVSSNAAAYITNPAKLPPQLKDSPVSIASRKAHRPAAPWRMKSVIRDNTPRLNPSQRQGVDQVLVENRTLTFIQGPPGTGKTTTAIEIAIGMLQQGKGPILVTAFTNQGTDNLAAGLYNRGVDVKRIGSCPMSMPWAAAAPSEKELQNTDVIAATCIGSGMPSLNKLKFPFVIIDEAAAMIEPACLIPICKGAVQCVMVGDQCQLPAVVLSDGAKNKLSVSIFERMLACGMEIHPLSIQYRMHALIAHFPSWRFYDGRLKSGVPLAERTHKYIKTGITSSLGFVNVDGENMRSGRSWWNMEELQAIVSMISVLINEHGVEGDQIGVITPYLGQVQQTIRYLREAGGEFLAVDVSSVDSFQGREKEIILLSTVKTEPSGSVEFISDWRRVNVQLTRAKKMCVVVGNLKTLCSSRLWRDWFGFHASLPNDSVSWCDYRDGEVIPMDQNPKAVDLVSTAQIEFARTPENDIKKKLPLQGNYPGMVVEVKDIIEEVAVDRRRRAKKSQPVVAIVADKEQKAIKTSDEYLAEYLQKRLVEMESEITSSGGKGDWTGIMAISKQIGLSLYNTERRVDENDGCVYSKEQFVECYGSEEEWNKSKVAEIKKKSHTSAPNEQPTKPPPPTTAAPPPAAKPQAVAAKETKSKQPIVFEEVCFFVFFFFFFFQQKKKKNGLNKITITENNHHY